MSTVCPGCGVAVVAGYIRCPKCHAGLPYAGGRGKRTTVEPGGTALARRPFPLTAVLVGAGAILAVIIVLSVRGGGKPAAAVVPPPEPIGAYAPPTADRPYRQAPFAAPVTAPAPAAPDPGAAISELESALRVQRLWGRADIVGTRVTVRSGSCADPAMQPLIETKRALLHSAGLTSLRCVEQSGAVVFEHQL